MVSIIYFISVTFPAAFLSRLLSLSLLLSLPLPLSFTVYFLISHSLVSQAKWQPEPALGPTGSRQHLIGLIIYLGPGLVQLSAWLMPLLLLLLLPLLLAISIRFQLGFGFVFAICGLRRPLGRGTRPFLHTHIKIGFGFSCKPTLSGVATYLAPNIPLSLCLVYLLLTLSLYLSSPHAPRDYF